MNIKINVINLIFSCLAYVIKDFGFQSRTNWLLIKTHLIRRHFELLIISFGLRVVHTKYLIAKKKKNILLIFDFYNFSVNYEDLHRRYLQFSVYDFDRFSRHDLIGQVVLKGLLDTTALHQEIEYTMNILCPPQVSFSTSETFKLDFDV